MKKKYAHIDLPPDLQAFRTRFIAATEVEATMCGITFYKMQGRYFARTKSSLAGKRVRRDKKFRRTMHNAAVLALASEYVTSIYNALTDDWHCHDLYRKLVGIGVRLLHQGNTKEAVQQAVYAALERLGYRTEWPVWQMPPELAKWVEEEEPGALSTESGAESTVTDAVNEKPVQAWVVNEKGQLAFVGLTSNEYYLSDFDISSTVSGFTHRDNEVVRPP